VDWQARAGRGGAGGDCARRCGQSARHDGRMGHGQLCHRARRDDRVAGEPPLFLFLIRLFCRFLFISECLLPCLLFSDHRIHQSNPIQSNPFPIHSGFRGSPQHEHPATPHLAMTYAALCSLSIVGAAPLISTEQREVIFAGIAACQRADGSVAAWVELRALGFFFFFSSFRGCSGC
jgi:hypothetical protein